MSGIIDLSSEQLRALAPPVQQSQVSPIGAVAPPVFNIPAPMPTTNYFGGSRLRGLGGSRPASLNGMYSEIDRMQKQRAEQEAAMQAQQLADALVGVDPTTPSYAQQRFELARRFPLAQQSPGGESLLQAYDTRAQVAEEIRLREEKQRQDALKAEQERMDAAMEQQFLSGLYSASDIDEIDALVLTAPTAAAKYNSIVQSRMRRFAPETEDPLERQNFWMRQQSSALRLAEDLAQPEAVRNAARQQAALAQQALANLMAPQAMQAVGPSVMPPLSTPVAPPAPRRRDNILGIQPVPGPTPTPTAP